MTAGRPILVTGVGGPAGRSLVDQLLGRGFDVVGVDLGPVRHARVRCARVPAADDPGFAMALLGIATGTDARLVIPTVTEELAVPELGSLGLDSPGGPRVVLGPLPAISVAADRWLTCQRLERAHVPVPRHALPSEVPTPADIVDRLGLPFVSRPRRGGGVVLHADPVSEPPVPVDDSAVLQEYVPGEEFTVNLYLGRNPYRDLVVVLLRSGATVRRVSAPDVADVAHRAARAIGLTGPADIDVRLRADGTPVVLGITARFGRHSAHASEVLDAVLAEHLPASVAAAAAPRPTSTVSQDAALRDRS